MPTAVLLPASFVAFGAERFFLTVADRLDTTSIDSQSSQRIFHRAGTLVTQGQVVVGRSALVAVSFNRKIHVRMLTEVLRVGLDRCLLVATNVGLIVIEIHILDVLGEQVLI